MTNYKKLTDPSDIVAQRRKDLELSQTDLAKKLGYSNVNFISLIESRKSKVPLEKSIEFAEALEMDTRWFAERVLRDRYPNVAETIFGPSRKN